MKKRIITFILALVLMGSIPVYANQPFTDVKESDYFYVSVMYASDRFIHGVGDNKFEPFRPLKVSEGIKLASCIHADFFKNELVPDTNAEHWADVYYDYALANGIMAQGELSKADFENYITRDRLFYLFANALPESEYAELNEIIHAPETPSTDYVKKLFLAGIVVGSDKGFELGENILRADAAELVTRMTAYSKRRIAYVPEDLLD